MKTNRKRLFSGIFLPLILSVLLILSSCAPKVPDGGISGDGEKDEHRKQEERSEDPESGEKDEKAEKTNYFERLPGRDYGGREFTVMTSSPEYIRSEDGNGVIAGSVNRRIDAVEKKYNIKINVVENDPTSARYALQNAGLTGENVCDLVFMPMDSIAEYGGNGLVYNIYSIPNFHYSAPYAEYKTTYRLSQNDVTYGVYGGAAYDARYLWCVFYNKEAFSELELEDPQELVKKGKWTWDTFREYANAAMCDLDGNKRIYASTDRVGYSSTANTSLMMSAFFASRGKDFFSFDENGRAFMDFDISKKEVKKGEAPYNYVYQLRDICVMNKAIYPVRNPGKTAFDAFCGGHLAFFVEKLSYLPLVSESSLSWGILPMPKEKEHHDGYHSWVDPSVCGFAVPTCCADTQLAGDVLSALYAYTYDDMSGYDHSTRNLLRTAWINYYLPDNDSAIMLGKILENPVYDIAYAFGKGMPDFSMASYELLQSVMEKNVDFDYLYLQSASPFSEFIKKRFFE